MKFAVSALVLILTTLCFAQAPQVARDVVKGSGYEVTLPADVVANVSPNDEMSHGFAIDLLRPGSEHHWDRTPTRYIGFKTNWELGESSSLNEVVRLLTNNLETLIPPEI